MAFFMFVFVFNVGWESLVGALLLFNTFSLYQEMLYLQLHLSVSITEKNFFNKFQK